MLRKKKILIVAVVVVLALGYLGYTSFAKSSVYYLTPTELRAQGEVAYGKTVRVSGLVAPGSVEQETKGLILRFKVVDSQGGENLPIFYQGAVPDTFKVGNEITVEGHLNSDGVFQAHALMPKCPSRYVPAE